MKNQSAPWFMLASRSLLFLAIQGLFALILFSAGTRSAWDESARWWTLIVSLANFVSLYLLTRAFKAEEKNFWDIMRFTRETWKSDLLFLLGFCVVGIPIAAAPKDPLAVAIFGDSMIATKMMFLPLPAWGFALSFLFPLTIWFSELPTYFGYCLPRLFRKGESATRPYLAWLIASFFLAAQHMFLPFILNGGYLLWRFGMFLPFALITGLALRFRPRLLPYFVIVHALMDVTTVLVYIMI